MKQQQRLVPGRRTAIPTELIFALSSLAIIFAGVRLSRDGDAIADHTGLGSAWVGAVLVAGATSLPELMTDSFAVLDNNVNLALGDLFGSSMANMLILAVADLAIFRRHFLTRVAVNQLLVAALAISLTAIIVAGIVANEPSTFMTLGWAPLMAFLVYLSGMRLLHVNRKPPPFESEAEAEQPRETTISIHRAAIGFALATLVIVVAARFLADSSGTLADKYGLSQGFFGVAFLAVTTSLPEASVTIEAVRRGSYDLAVGNLLGSNCFNMAIPFVLEIVNGEESLLANVDPGVSVGAMFAILLTAMTMMEILHKSERRVWLIEPDALIRIAVYVLGLFFIYRVG